MYMKKRTSIIKKIKAKQILKQFYDGKIKRYFSAKFDNFFLFTQTNLISRSNVSLLFIFTPQTIRERLD